jgi:integrase
MFPWAVENRKLATNPATGFLVCVPKRVRSRGPSFTAMEVRTILSGSLVMDQGRVSPEHALARRWIPWMCAYSGARVGEIAQMRGSEIVEIEGVWAMRITPEAGSTKNGHSGIVALHPHLLEQGLLTIARRAGVSRSSMTPSGRAEVWLETRTIRRSASGWPDRCAIWGWTTLTSNRTMAEGTCSKR